jgi:hypothetical protein
VSNSALLLCPLQIIAAADKVISLIDTKVLADWFAQKSEPEGEDAAKVSCN